VALTAAVAVTLATICAAAISGGPALLLGLVLVPGVALTALRPDRSLRFPPWLVKWFPVVVVAVVAAVALPAKTTQPFRYMIILAIPTSLLWPRTIRWSLYFAIASLLGAPPSLAAVAWPLAGFAAATAVALVALNRMRGPTGHRLAGRGRATATDAAAVLAIAGVGFWLFAALLPSPETSNRPSAGRSPQRSPSGSRAPVPVAPYLQLTERLDAGAGGTGKGNQIVFRVTAPRTALWRTMTFDDYDGRTWGRSPEASVPVDSGGPQVFVPVGEGVDFGARPPFVQRTRVEAPAVGVLPAAAWLSRVDLPDGHRADVATDGTVAPDPQLGKGATYVATSYPPPAAAEVLRRHSAGAGEEELPDEVEAYYLSFPGLPERVVQLAEEVAAGATTEYDQVHAVETWLRSNTRTALDAPALPPGADPIDQFLFTDHRGSAQQAASAMAIMLRSLDIPARLAVGYVSPRPSALGGEMVVRARHAHAWVEAWFPGAGWVAFDPAGRFTAPGEDVDSLWSRVKRLVAALWWLLIPLVAALVAWLGARWLRRRRRRRARPWATRTYERIEAAGVKRGRPRRPGETPVEYCAALAADLHDDRLAGVGALVSQAAWSRDEPAPEARAWADDVVGDLRMSRRRTHTPG